MNWVTEIRTAMEVLGGHARYVDLYEYLENTTDRDLTEHWKASVRRTIQQHSADSESFTYTDVFSHLGVGHWGLRNRNISKAEIQKRLSLSPKEVFVEAHWRKRPESQNLKQNDQITLEVSFWAMQIFTSKRLGLTENTNFTSKLLFDEFCECVKKAQSKT